MPYFIEQTDQGWNTVKDDGTILGKHKNKKEAIAQMVAVSLAEDIPAGGELKRAVEAGTYDPPKGVSETAKRALKWIDEGLAGQGFTAVGRRRASQLASGQAVSADTVNRMISYFARHSVDRKAQGFNFGEEGYPSAGRVAWDAWGGDAGQSWVNTLNDQQSRVLDVEDTKIEGDAKMEGYAMTDLHGEITQLKSETLELIGKLSATVYSLSELVEAMIEPVMEDQPADSTEPTIGLEVEEDSVRFVEPEQVAELAKRGERVSKGIEQRIAFQNLEIRAEGDGMTLRGYAAVFNSPSQPLPFTETIQPGAFRDSLKLRNDIKLLWNHDTGIVLGSTRAGTLRLNEDNVGLFLEANLPDTQAGRDAATLVKRGDVNAFSFGFRIPAGGDEWVGSDQRILKRINIHETSLVAFPAYTSTEGTASVRSLTDLQEKIARLAEIRGVSAEELTSALLALESGEELTERQGELLTETLNKVLQKDPEITNVEALLDLKKKQLDLLMNKV